MNIPRTCIVDPIIKIGGIQLKALSQRFTVIPHLSPPDPRAVEGMLVHSKITAGFASQFPNLQWIGVRAQNTTYVANEVKERVHVFGIPSLADVAVLEHTFALILGLTKQLIVSHQNVVKGAWQDKLAMNTEIGGKTIGIIGYGKIGKLVGEMAACFRMKVLFANSLRHPLPSAVPIEDLLRRSDIVTLHLSSRPENIGFMSKLRFSQMKQGSIFINTSRGNMVNETALFEALKSGHLGGAGLDVFETEPLYTTPLALLSNVVLTPHVGYVTKETTQKMTDALVKATLDETKSVIPRFKI